MGYSELNEPMRYRLGDFKFWGYLGWVNSKLSSLISALGMSDYPKRNQIMVNLWGLGILHAPPHGHAFMLKYQKGSKVTSTKLVHHLFSFPVAESPQEAEEVREVPSTVN